MTTADITVKFDYADFGLDVTFALPTTGISGLFGPSGSGKTTLIRCLAGLERPSRALIRMGDSLWQSEAVFLPPHKRRLGMVFQDVRLFDHLTVMGNLLFGHKRTKPEARKIKIEDVLEILDLTPLLDKRPENLSGGEAQRVAIGRALLTSPALLLMDEPLAALGEQHKKDILPYLKNLPRNFGIPVLYVSHDFEEIAALTQYIICLKDGQIQTQGNLLEVACSLPHVMDRWAPDNHIAGDTTGNGQFRLADGQNIPLPARGHSLHPVINARDITLLPAPGPHAGDAMLTGKIIEISRIYDGRNLIRISLAGQEIHAVLGARGAQEPWISPGHDIHMMINRIKWETQ